MSRESAQGIDLRPHRHALAENRHLFSPIHQLPPHRALPRDHIRVVERVHKGQLLLFTDGLRVDICLVKGVAKQHDLAAPGRDRHDLHLRRGHGHHDDGVAAEALGRQGDALRVVARRGADHAALQHRRDS